jgi:hypothetical protein
MKDQVKAKALRHPEFPLLTDAGGYAKFTRRMLDSIPERRLLWKRLYRM